MVNFYNPPKIGISDNSCDGCEKHGFPCIRCSDVIYNGELGPGFQEGNRLINGTISTHALKNMLLWISMNPQKDVYVTAAFKNMYSIKDQDLLSINTTLVSDPYLFCIS